MLTSKKSVCFKGLKDINDNISLWMAVMCECFTVDGSNMCFSLDDSTM